MDRRHRLPFRLLALLLALTFAGACGGDDGDSTAADTRSAISGGDDAADGGTGGEGTDDAAQGEDAGEQGEDASGGDADGQTVRAAGIAFKPAKITVPVGATVTWEFDDGSIPHNVVFDDGPKSETKTDGTYERRFDEAGSFPYKCTLHPTMKGTVTVR